MNLAPAEGLINDTVPCGRSLEMCAMGSFAGKNVVVIGGSRGVGRRIVEAGLRDGARVLAVARGEDTLRQLSDKVAGVETLSADATDEAVPFQVFGRMLPDVLVVCGGAYPPAAPLHELSWDEFAVNWSADTKIAFNFFKAALLRPLPKGAVILLISSGAAFAGSPNSGGYAGAKRTQIFLANYSQKESDRLGLGLRFISVAPRIMADTDFGQKALVGYSRYLSKPVEEVIKAMPSAPTSSDVADAVSDLASNPDPTRGSVFIVSGQGLEAVPS
jgi:NAD(P)-dependent dehydrogenase (short-subunit alcohol dehydrogenase family)